MTDTLERTAQLIAERGRAELAARLRTAFQEVAGAHSDALTRDSQRLEEMVQRGVERADGLQWRHALARVASEHLGIGMGEALTHPAVARAQALAGAPSYEESLTRLKGAAKPATVAAARQATDQVPEPTTAAAVEAPEPEPESAALAPEPQSEPEPPPAPAPSRQSNGMLRIAAVHLGGIANLSPAERGLELRLSSDGLDIAREDSEVLGRLVWEDISALEVPPPRGLLRRVRSEAHLVIRTARGDASFHVPELSPDELRRHLDSAVARYRPA